jgi:hypothetical protein
LPPVQATPPEQEAEAPQWAGSVSGLMQALEQATRPDWQLTAQAPTEQTCPPPHALPWWPAAQSRLAPQ